MCIILLQWNLSIELQNGRNKCPIERCVYYRGSVVWRVRDPSIIRDSTVFVYYNDVLRHSSPINS